MTEFSFFGWTYPLIFNLRHFFFFFFTLALNREPKKGVITCNLQVLEPVTMTAVRVKADKKKQQNTASFQVQSLSGFTLTSLTDTGAAKSDGEKGRLRVTTVSLTSLKSICTSREKRLMRPRDQYRRVNDNAYRAATRRTTAPSPSSEPKVLGLCQRDKRSSSWGSQFHSLSVCIYLLQK